MPPLPDDTIFAIGFVLKGDRRLWTVIQREEREEAEDDEEERER
jgi:hypothetical protein